MTIPIKNAIIPYCQKQDISVYTGINNNLPQRKTLYPYVQYQDPNLTESLQGRYYVKPDNDSKIYNANQLSDHIEENYKGVWIDIYV